MAVGGGGSENPLSIKFWPLNCLRENISDKNNTKMFIVMKYSFLI